MKFSTVFVALSLLCSGAFAGHHEGHNSCKPHKGCACEEMQGHAHGKKMRNPHVTTVTNVGDAMIVEPGVSTTRDNPKADYSFMGSNN